MIESMLYLNFEERSVPFKTRAAINYYMAELGATVIFCEISNEAGLLASYKLICCGRSRSIILFIYN
jgi:hypothetical protein